MEDRRFKPYVTYRDDEKHHSPNNYKMNSDFEETSDETEGKRNICRDFLFLLPLIAFILICFFSVCLLLASKDNQTVDFKEQRSVLTYLDQNYKKDLWEECKAVPKEQACGTGLKEENIGKFQGLKEGCICKDGTVHNHLYCQKTSSSKCKWYAGNANKDYKFWKTRKFCVKKISDWKVLGKGEACTGAGKKKCGNYCVAATKCPITKIELKPRVPSGFTQISFVEKSNFDVNKDIYIQRDATANGVINIDAKVSDFPCAASSLKNPQTASGKFYPLEKVPYSGCGKYGNLAATSEKLDSHLDSMFLKENKIWEGMNNVPFIENFRNKKDYYNLYTIHKISTKNEKVCHDVDPKGSEKIEKGIKDMNENLYIYTLLLIILSSIGIVLSLMFILMRKQLKFLNNRGTVVLILVILLACAVIAIIMFCHHKDKVEGNDIKKPVDHYNTMAKKGCFKLNNFKSAAQDISTGTHKVLHNLNWLVWTVFIIAVVCAALYILAALIRGIFKLSVLPDPKF